MSDGIASAVPTKDTPPSDDVVVDDVVVDDVVVDDPPKDDDKPKDDDAPKDDDDAKKDDKPKDDDDKADDAPEGAPEGDYSFDVPEGFAQPTEADATALSEFGKAYDVPQPMMDAAVKMLAAREQRNLEAMAEAKDAQTVANEEAGRADPIVGGENYEKNVAGAGAMIFRVFQGANEQISEKDHGHLVEFTAELADSGMDNSVAALRFFHNLSKMVTKAQDTLVPGAPPKVERDTSAKGRAARIYPTSVKE